MVTKNKKIRLVSDFNKVQWKKSASCTETSCVEVAKIGRKFAVRDSKDTNGAVLLFTKSEWKAFIAGVKHDEFV